MIVIVDTGIANRHSVRNAFEFIECPVEVSRDPAVIRAADRLVFPGVGAFAQGMKSLAESKLMDTLTEEVVGKGKPILGICLGFQLMAEKSFENGEHEGLGWIPGTVRRLEPTEKEIKVPHVGFNSVGVNRGSTLFRDIPDPSFYFVHSYFLDTDSGIVSATCEYGQSFVAAIETGNIMGTQFHPEKSQAAGLRVLKNFAEKEF